MALFGRDDNVTHALIALRTIIMLQKRLVMNANVCRDGRRTVLTATVEFYSLRALFCYGKARARGAPLSRQWLDRRSRLREPPKRCSERTWCGFKRLHLHFLQRSNCGHVSMNVLQQ
jgi:hypothetical protein